MKNLLINLFVILIISSCGNTTHEEYANEYEIVEDELAYKSVDAEGIIPITRQANSGLLAVEPPSEPVTIDKKIIKDARIGVEVEDFTSYRIRLDSLIAGLNAYVSNDNLDKSDYSINSNLTIRIPSKNFDYLVNSLEKGTTKLLYKNISARDVTEEFIDIEARLKTKKEVEKRYIQLLSKAKNIKEILEVEEKLRVIREEIEAREGRLNYLKKQVSYSTIYLNITQKIEYKYEPVKQKSFFQRLFKSLDKGWKGFVGFLLFLFRLWPVIVIGLAIFYYIRRVRRKSKQKKNNQIK